MLLAPPPTEIKLGSQLCAVQSLYRGGGGGSYKMATTHKQMLNMGASDNATIYILCLVWDFIKYEIYSPLGVNMEFQHHI